MTSCNGEGTQDSPQYDYKNATEVDILGIKLYKPTSYKMRTSNRTIAALVSEVHKSELDYLKCKITTKERKPNY